MPEPGEPSFDRARELCAAARVEEAVGQLRSTLDAAPEDERHDLVADFSCDAEQLLARGLAEVGDDLKRAEGTEGAARAEIMREIRRKLEVVSRVRKLNPFHARLLESLQGEDRATRDRESGA